MDYEQDVFIAYRRWLDRENGVPTAEAEWVPHFARMLEQRLALAAPRRLTVYWDGMLGNRPDPAERVRQIAVRSRVLVPVLSPMFFGSKHCCSELRTFEARAGGGNSQHIYAIRFADGEHYPEQEAERYQNARDFEDHSYPFDISEGSGKGPFERAVGELARELAEIVEACPRLDPAWSYVDSPALMSENPARTMNKPRLGRSGGAP